ncbi:hypothetical protein LTR53_006925 [Teratosphaeriaceae sp. CCFEE 6253]|nr:hypothetical protein LTR53_006925 [Teratosphaeriaceae sp. CCFEE 6253]
MAPLISLYLLLTTLVATIATQASQSVPSDCTSAAWLQALSQSGCLGSVDEIECMCTVEANYLLFYDDNLTCMFQDEFTGLSSEMECIGYRHRVRDAATTGPAPASVASIDLPVPTTFATRVKRAPVAQIAALTPYQTIPPSRGKKQPTTPWSSNSYAHTIWYCGVPGAACNEAAVGSDTQPEAFNHGKPDHDSIPGPLNSTYSVPPHHSTAAGVFPPTEKRQDLSNLLSALYAIAAAQQTTSRVDFPYGQSLAQPPPPPAMKRGMPITTESPVPMTTTATSDVDCSTSSAQAHRHIPTPIPDIGICEKGIQCADGE